MGYEVCDTDSYITWPYQIADHKCRITWVYNKINYFLLVINTTFIYSLEEYYVTGLAYSTLS